MVKCLFCQQKGSNPLTLKVIIASWRWYIRLHKKKNKKKSMPQLVPFYYMNEIVFAFSLIVIILYILSKFILPRIVRLFVSRMFINKI